jgi:hypothetical protein
MSNTRAAFSKRKLTHAHVRLRDRETARRRFGPTTPIYAEIPPRLRAPIERILDRERRLLRAVVLGFTADGGHVVAHHHDRANGGEHWVQFWTFDVHGKRPSRLVRDVPVMRERDGSSMRDTKNARATVVSFAQSPCEEHFFFNFQLLSKKEDRGEETRPEQGGYFCFFPNPLKLRNETTTTFREGEGGVFPRKIFERKEREGMVARDDEENVMTAEAARVLVKGERYTSSAIVPYCSIWSGMVRGDSSRTSSSPRYSIFLNLGDGILEAIYQPLANIKRPDRASSELWVSKHDAKRDIFNVAANKFEMLSELENAKFQCRDYELMPLKTIGKTLAARMHCVLENVQSMTTRMIVVTFAIEASSGHGFDLPGVDILDVSETNVPLSMPTMMSEGVKTQAFMPSARARLRTYKLLLNAAQSEAIEMRRASGLSRMRANQRYRNSSEGDNANLVYKNKSVNVIVHDTLPVCLLGYGVVVSERNNLMPSRNQRLYPQL